MIKNKIYTLLQKYIAEYLFGFDKNKLDVAILSGYIDLKDVNIRPDKANAIVAKLNLPIALKAGMIGKMKLKFNLTSWYSNPVDIEIEDLQLIIGPNLSHMSKDDNFLPNDDKPYDDGGYNNIFHYQLKAKDINTPFKDFMDRSPEEQKAKQDTFCDKYLNNIMQNLKASIKKIHIRYEDDYIAQYPYAFGFMIDSIIWTNSNSDWKFAGLDQTKFTKAPIQGKYLAKELTVINMAIYYKSMAEMFIPTSLWESTKHLKFQIFDALPLDELRNLMKNSFANDYIIEPFSIYSNIQYNGKQEPFATAFPDYRIKVEALFTKLSLNIKIDHIKSFLGLAEFIENFSIREELMNYRPVMRPIVPDPKEKNISLQEKEKRRRIVRDWLFLAVWANRIKKVFKEMLRQRDSKSKDLRRIAVKLAEMQIKSQGKSSMSEEDRENLITQMESQIVEKQKKLKISREKQFYGSLITMRMQEIHIQLYGPEANEGIATLYFKVVLNNVHYHKKTYSALKESVLMLNKAHIYDTIKNLIRCEESKENINKSNEKLKTIPNEEAHASSINNVKISPPKILPNAKRDTSILGRIKRAILGEAPVNNTRQPNSRTALTQGVTATPVIPRRELALPKEQVQVNSVSIRKEMTPLKTITLSPEKMSKNDIIHKTSNGDITSKCFVSMQSSTGFGFYLKISHVSSKDDLPSSDIKIEIGKISIEFNPHIIESCFELRAFINELSFYRDSAPVPGIKKQRFNISLAKIINTHMQKIVQPIKEEFDDLGNVDEKIDIDKQPAPAYKAIDVKGLYQSSKKIDSILSKRNFTVSFSIMSIKFAMLELDKEGSTYTISAIPITEIETTDLKASIEKKNQNLLMELLNTKIKCKYSVTAILNYIEKLNDSMKPLFESEALNNYAKVCANLREVRIKDYKPTKKKSSNEREQGKIMPSKYKSLNDLNPKTRKASTKSLTKDAELAIDKEEIKIGDIN